MTVQASDQGLAETGLDRLRQQLAAGGCPLYVGRGNHALGFSQPERAMLVIGPPRSGKTTGVLIPNLLATPGSAVSTSTKPDVMAATMESRKGLGRCWLFDPSGATAVPSGVEQLRWSPVQASRDWDAALAAARGLVRATGGLRTGGEAAHWVERAEALLSVQLHAAAVTGKSMRDVNRRVLRRELDDCVAELHARTGASPIAADVAAGLIATEGRELSGIFSTASGALAAYRSEAALAAACHPNFDPAAFVREAGTVYVCASATSQEILAPIVVAFVDAIKEAAYRCHAATARPTPPVLLALDEVANIAPLPDLPSIVAEGGSQGVTTLACIQDLSQARQRWGRAAEGFLTLFGTKVILPGVAEASTLELISRLAGEVDLPRSSISRPFGPFGRASATVSHERRRRLPPHMVSQLPSGRALVIEGSTPPALSQLGPWWQSPPFDAAVRPRAQQPPRFAPGLQAGG